ncbi:MAG: radical SAM protein [Candidatus Omnitrophica bacterium]|nr:radical SAM protein [Candidatus Omnitrophota bacterium]MCK5287419.1 radical SAM protein [Candidatus Omnitrophota bacterium]
MCKNTTPPNLETWLMPIDMLKSERLIQSIDIELSRECNNFCMYCFTNAGKAVDNELSISEIKKVIREGKDIGIKQVVIVGGGEPLLYKGLEEIIDFIKNNDLEIIILTNGLLLDTKKLDYFYKNKVHIIIKLNAINDGQIHDYLVGKNGSFKKVQKVISSVLKKGYGLLNNPKVAIESIICKTNIQEISVIWRWARNNNILPIMELITPQGRASKMKDLFLSKEEANKLFFQLSEIDKNEYNYEWIPVPPIAGFFCRRNDYSCYITSCGDVFPCSGIDISIGNVRNESLLQILEDSTLIKKLRKSDEYLEGECGRCILKGKCYGCRGKAYQVYGNLFAEDPLCWFKGKNRASLERIVREIS